MNQIKAYVELHAGNNWPQVEFCFNNQPVIPKNKNIVYSSEQHQNIIFEFDVKLQNCNCFQVCMDNKTDEELFSTEVGFSKHYIILREVEVDLIKFEENFLKNCQVTHNMSDHWIEEKKQFGLELDPVYFHTNELRFNGCCSVRFTQPIWQWYSQQSQNL